MTDRVSPKQAALLIFVDVIDSSVYSTILGYDRFAKKVLDFQSLFNDLGRLYFNNNPRFKERIDSFCQINAAGDEGLVFLIDPRQKPTDLVHKAVKFVLELKARFKIISSTDLVHKMEKDLPPQGMRIAAGIHYGFVSPIFAIREVNGIPGNRIDRIVGYSINYAKRVETASRIGKYSNVFLSRNAGNLLKDFPIILQKHQVSLKGIQDKDEVLEVMSTFLEEIPLLTDKILPSNQDFIDYFLDNFRNTNMFQEEPWLKSFVISVADSVIALEANQVLKEKYRKTRCDIAWQDLNEDDPILLYHRAIDCVTESKYSRAVSHLRKIVDKYPYFIWARTKLIEHWNNMLQSKIPASENIFIRDMAEELLEKYGNILLADEKEKLTSILKQVNERISSYKKQ